MSVRYVGTESTFDSDMSISWDISKGLHPKKLNGLPANGDMVSPFGVRISTQKTEWGPLHTVT